MTWQRIGHAITSGSGSAPNSDPLVDVPLRAAGDLMTYGVAFRATTSPGLPNFAGTTQSTVEVASSTGGNTTAAATGSIVSYVCGYRIITAADIAAGNPFTFPTAVTDAFFCECAIYRANTAGVTPTFISNGGLVLAAASTTVALGATTALAVLSGDLLVGYGFMARANTLSAWTCTGVGTASGATGTAAENPIGTNVWDERYDASTTSGADCAIAQVDAVMSSSTTLGNSQYTQSASCRSGGHLMVFREVVSQLSAPRVMDHRRQLA